MDQVKIAQAYSILCALKENLPAAQIADEKYLNQFHDVLETLEKETGFDLKTFRVPFSESRLLIKGREVSRTRSYPEPCDREFLMIRIDAVLKFFTIQPTRQESQPRTIGFNPH